MGTNISAKFDVTSWDESPFDEGAEGSEVPKLTHASVAKTYAGDITGESDTEWLMAYAADESATFVGIERIRGTVGGRSGTLVLQHVGKFEDGAARATLTVVEGSGSDELASARGSGDFLADPKGAVDLELTFD